jgi:hypothetical protein
MCSPQKKEVKANKSSNPNLPPREQEERQRRRFVISLSHKTNTHTNNNNTVVKGKIKGKVEQLGSL